MAELGPAPGMSISVPKDHITPLKWNSFSKGDNNFIPSSQISIIIATILDVILIDDIVFVLFDVDILFLVMGRLWLMVMFFLIFITRLLLLLVDKFFVFLFTFFVLFFI
ncbi:hypothetical protein TCAL_17032 [Tigriopus californicus]|uniref:Uncharacterized protein n=1 Tax=Tigriopus californicus TaxID=6832 RepID=A0A553PHR2_TIGCA|nr:hypothetical protein TCAL_17032 [Tigriopus californicus]